MNVKKNQVALLLGVLGILAGYLCWNFGYKKFNEQAEQVKNQAVAVEAEIAKYEALEQNRDFYLSETPRYDQDITLLTNQFPSYTLPEDGMKFVYEEDNYNSKDYMFVSTMNIAEPENVYTADYSAVDQSYAPQSGVIDTSNPYPVYSLYAGSTGLGVTTTYKGLKDLIADIYTLQNRKSISSVILAFDGSTGFLTGSVGMSDYYLGGSTKEYMQPTLAPVELGTENPFVTIEDVEETESTNAAN